MRLRIAVAGSIFLSLIFPWSASADPAIAVNPAMIDFGNVALCGISAPSTITIANQGQSDLHISMVAVAGNNPADFPIDTRALARTIAAGASSTMTVSIKPTAEGMRMAAIDIASDDPNRPMSTVLVTGFAVGFQIMPGKLDFGAQRTFVASAPQKLELTNQTCDTLSILSINFMGPQSTWFRVVGLPVLPIAVAPGGKAAIELFAVPLARVPSPGTATFTITSDDPMIPTFSLPMKVTGVSPTIFLKPDFLDFGAVAVGVGAVAKQTIMMANTGTADLAISDATLLSQSGAFALVNPLILPVVIAPNASINLDVTFKPAAVGRDKGEIDLITDDPFAQHVHIPVSGVGALAGLVVTPTLLDFRTVVVDAQPVPQDVTITNTGGVALAIASVSLVGAGASEFRFDDPGPFILYVGLPRTIPITYAPASTGVHNASLVVTASMLLPVVVKLTGSAVSPWPWPGGGPNHHDFGSVPVGVQSDPFVVHIRNASATVMTFTEFRSPDPAFIIDTHTPPTLFNLPPGASTLFNVTFLPTEVRTYQGIISVFIKGQSNPLENIFVAGTGVVPPSRQQPIAQGCAVSPRAAIAFSSLWPILAALILCARRRKQFLDR